MQEESPSMHRCLASNDLPPHSYTWWEGRLDSIHLVHLGVSPLYASRDHDSPTRQCSKNH